MNNQSVNIKFDINITNSTALKRFQYNSQTGIITVTFTNDRAYEYVGASVHAVMSFLAFAVQKDSWGRAWNDWARTQDLTRSETIKKGAEILFEDMSFAELALAKEALLAAESRLASERAAGRPRRDFYATRNDW